MIKKIIQKEIKEIIKSQNLSCTIDEFKDSVDWYKISIHQKLSEPLIKEFKDSVDWYSISQYQKLSEPFIKEFKDSVEWYSISQYQKLSEPFIKEFKDSVDWYWISKFQKLSEPFIKEFKDSVDWDWISQYQKLSEPFIKEFNIEIDPDNWLYKDTDFKLNRVIETGLYEIRDGKIIAYKGIRSDKYSNYNFQYQYLEGQIYESHSDYTSDENSFGLSAWTEEKARQHCNQLIAIVEIDPSDITRIVHDGGKIRCRKQKIIGYLK
jgi:hypothetical protein